MSFEKPMQSCNKHHNQASSSVSILSFLVPGNHWSDFWPFSFAFSRISHKLFSLDNVFELNAFSCMYQSQFLSIFELYFIVWMYHNMFILSPIDDYLGYFYVLVTMNKAARNILVSVFVWIFYLGKYVGKGILVVW